MPKCEVCKYKKTKFFYKKDGYDYYECPRCITFFLYPKPTLNQINSYYKKSFKYTAGAANEKQIHTSAKLILQTLRKMNPTGNSLLDIGSGYGYLLDEAKKADLDPTGIEPSKSLYTTSIKRLIEVSIQNITFDNYFAKNKTKKFDFVTIIHTVEHVFNPKELIDKAVKLLNKNGILYIETPNLDSHLFRAEKYNYTFLTPPDHIWLFSKKSFKTILNKIKNVEILKISSYSSPEHFMGIIKRIFKKNFINKPEFISDSILSFPRKRESRKDTGSPLKGTIAQSRSGMTDRVKYLIFDKLLAPIFTPLLNIGIYGSTLGLYIRKK